MRHASLFSGIGGFDLAAQWMGWQNVFSCEKDPFCRKVLKHYWPKTKSYEDIYQFDATQYRRHVEIISAGFPCQPFSLAGRRKGKTDDRYLWPQTRRVITEVRPKWIVLENVAGLFTILEPEGLSEMEYQAVELFCQDNGQDTNQTIVRIQRRVIGTIISEIQSAGYELPRLEDGTPIVLCIPACAVGAAHRRDRVWFVARDADLPADIEGFADWFGGGRVDPNAYGNGLHTSYGPDEIHAGETWDYAQPHIGAADIMAAGRGGDGPAADRRTRQFKWWETVPDWQQWPSEPPLCSGADGLPGGLDTTAFQQKWRRESVKAYGNAIVPQVALEIFKTINIIEKGIRSLI